MVGIDGTGKTTHARSLVCEMQQRGIPGHYTWCRGAPKYFLPTILLVRRIVYGRSVAEFEMNETDLNLKWHVFSNPLLSKVWRAILLFDTLIQVLVSIRIPMMIGRVVVSDRYVFDQMVDLAVDFRLSRPQLEKLAVSPVYRLFPNPDITFLLDTDEASAYSRKPDVRSISDLAERRRTYFWLFRFFSMKLVDASGNFDAVQRTLSSQVFDLLSRKLTYRDR
jgi:dTMP kinase